MIRCTGSSLRALFEKTAPKLWISVIFEHSYMACRAGLAYKDSYGLVIQIGSAGLSEELAYDRDWNKKI